MNCKCCSVLLNEDELCFRLLSSNQLVHLHCVNAKNIHILKNEKFELFKIKIINCDNCGIALNHTEYYLKELNPSDYDGHFNRKYLIFHLGCLYPGDQGSYLGKKFQIERN